MPTKTYSEQDVLAAIAERKSGAKIVDLVAKYKIPDRSLRRLINMEKKGNQKKRSGPPPPLGNALQKDLRDWVIGTQRKGFPPTRDDGTINNGKRTTAFSRRTPSAPCRNEQIIKVVRPLFQEVSRACHQKRAAHQKDSRRR
uniref:AlNc14C174G8080 protein n=1 Tax=Albugo laibachii Nc14 TaxID=890382 RepID=F0WNR8_9STRA|nr:AlNc14C174G8080 [Albugo laibachii Nc14]|eukprot:CCA22960.1 AlNc14C174G8080 [Albugo laibachii Nc14]